jgi:DNA-directed RNA polymerase specialized sigma24 family protein
MDRLGAGLPDRRNRYRASAWRLDRPGETTCEAIRLSDCRRVPATRARWQKRRVPMPSKDESRRLTASTLASLLTRLDGDPERAGAAYESLRRALIGFFTWRGAATPEECADETLDRLAARVSEGVVVEDVPRFARGIARLVLLEHWRRPDARRAPLADVRSQPAEPRDDDSLHRCLDRCLAQLPPGGRDLILGYYVAEGRTRIDNRRRFAEALRVSESALRNRTQRLRDGLERCITECLARPPGEEADAGGDMET